MRCNAPFPLWSLAAGILLCASAATAQFSLDREPPGPSSRRTGLALTEIMYQPLALPGLATNQTLEFVEIYNSKPWAEDLSGYRLDGGIRYTLPTNTMLAAKSYLVVARVPDLVHSNYNITNVIGPWIGATTNSLPADRGTIQLRNRLGAVLLEVTYANNPPWPLGARKGHSLVLARPSYGENDVRAWSESDAIGGSPGKEDPLTRDPLACVVINEWGAHNKEYIELYNHSNEPVDLSGAWLSDDSVTNKFRIPNGTTLNARDFRVFDYNQGTLNFKLFAGGENLYLVNSNQNRVIDAIDYKGQSNYVAEGRFPDGGPYHYGMASTMGAANAEPFRYPVVINEIMYNPISGDSDDEYLELYNRSHSSVNLSGWTFLSGITYTFATNSASIMPAGAYWVLAKNPTSLMTIYTNLSTANTFGPYGGTLANGGERLTLVSADYDTITTTTGRVTMKLDVVNNEVTYGTGGRWGNWSDGSGSSLELIDPEADTQLSANWADSEDPGESLWTAIEWSGPVGEVLGPEVNDSLSILMQGIGECLLDEVEVRVNNGPNLVENGGFESGLSGWALQGSHDFSTLENSGFAGSSSLHVRAGSRGDNQSNRILSAPFAQPIPTNAIVALRAKVRWIRGHPEILLRLHGSATEAYGRMALPRKLGTPGAPNSRKVANAGPAVYEVKHAPILPAPGDAVVVTARASDPQSVPYLALFYRLDPESSYTELPMTDDGTAGDAIAGDGIYSAQIPAQAAGAIVAFYVQGLDDQMATGTFPKEVFPPAGLDRCWPSDAPIKECVVRWGEVQMPGDFATYHLWITSANSNRWRFRNAMDNTSMDGTFIYNNSRVIYNAQPLYSGSPWHRANATNGPTDVNRTDYQFNFPDDDQLLGNTDFVLNNPGNPDVLTVSDHSALAEQTVAKIFERMDMIHHQRRYVHVFINGSQRSTIHERSGNFIFEDSQQPNGDVIDEWFPDDAGGQLYKLDDWFEFGRNGYDILDYNDADLARRVIVANGQTNLAMAPYRFMFRKRSVNVGSSANDYSPILNLVNAVSPANAPDSATVDPDAFDAIANYENWMRFFAVQRAVGNYDSYGWRRGKNDYLYGAAAGLTHLPWDIDYSLGLGAETDSPLFETSDPRVAAMFNTPLVTRAYWRAFAELVEGPFSNTVLDPFIDSHVAALTNNQVNIDLDRVAAIKAYIRDRNAFLRTQLATVATTFGQEGPATFDTTNNLLTIVGSAPVQIKTITVNGMTYPISWISPTNFLLRIGLDSGLNTIVLLGFDRFGNAISQASNVLQVTYTGPVVNPVGALVISEIMASPTNSGGQFLEIANHSDLSFDLRGWFLEGVSFTFPAGFIITNRQTVILAQNRSVFTAAYPGVPLAGVLGTSLSATGQVIALVRPTAAGDQWVSAVRYEAVAPWPFPSAGKSLQCLDLAQDNSRPSNWVLADPTPGATNAFGGSLPPYDPLWINEVQIESMTGPLDNAGESEPWLELYNSGPTPVSLDGYYLADNFSTNLTAWAFPTNATIAPGEFRLVWGDGQSYQTDDTNWHTSFRLANKGSLALVRLVEGQPQITDYLTWPRLGANAGQGSFPDGQLIKRGFLSEPTPGAPNHGTALRVFINEWMAKNGGSLKDPSDTASDDWFELFNAEPYTVDLGGYYLTDSAANPTNYMIPRNGQYRIAPGGFLLVWADNQASQNTAARADLHAGFQLSASAGDIGLFLPDGRTPVDVVTYGQQTADVSEGRYSDGASYRSLMPHPTPRSGNCVTNYNTPPKLTIPSDMVVIPPSNIVVLMKATDTDTNAITYAVDASPAGSQFISPSIFRWLIPSNQPNGIYPVTLRATDNGLPARTDVGTFNIYIIRPGAVITNSAVVITNFAPAIRMITSQRGESTFTVATLPGHTYRVFYRDDLAAGSWMRLGPDFVAANATASLTDALLAEKRFYFVLQLD